MTMFTFRLGDHALAHKRGHCTACSAAEVRVTVEAATVEEAVEKATSKLRLHASAVHGGTLSPERVALVVAPGLVVSVASVVTKRQLVRE